MKTPAIAFCAALTLGATTAQAAPTALPQGLDLQVLSERGEIKAHQLLIKFKPDTTQSLIESALRPFQVSGIRGFYQPRHLPAPALASLERWRVVSFLPGQDLTSAFRGLLGQQEIEYVVPNAVLKIAATPNDPSYAELWGLNNTGQSGGSADADVDAPAAWDLITDASSVTVAVIDTGIDYNHPDLAANMWRNPGEIAGNGIDDDGNGYIDDIHGYDFVNGDADPMDDHFHGTHVAGTIAAVGNNGVGVVGVAWKAKLMALKFLDESGSGYTSDAIDALLYAADMGARISNNSWGSFAYNSLAGIAYSRPLEDAIRGIGETGHLVIAAAGNNGNFVDGQYTALPAGLGLPNILSVAATDHNDQLADFSNYGPVEVDLAAPGVNILSTVPGNGYERYNGTSMATPHVAGAAALLLAKKPDLSPYELKAVLMNSVDALSQLSDKVLSGGRLNVDKALQAVTQAPCSAFTATPGGHITAGRAVACGSWNLYACAKGSNQNIGSRYGSTPVTLVQQSPGYYVQGSCSGSLNMPPAIFLSGAYEVNLLAGSSYTPPAATASDREDGDISTRISRTGSVDTGTPGDYVLSYSVSDSAGARAVTEKVLVHVLAEDTPPMVDLFGRTCRLPLICIPVLIEQHTPYVEDGYFGWDDLDGDLTEQVVPVGTVLSDTSAIGRYQVRYDVVDSAGQRNAAYEHVFREVFVLDAELPSIFNAEDFNVALNTCCLRQDVFSMDLKDGVNGVETTGSVDVGAEGTYVLQHLATDADGNTAAATQTVRVMRDVTPPAITLNGAPVMYVDQGQWFNDPYVTVTDDLDPYPGAWRDNDVDSEVPGTYVLNYYAEDETGNQAGPVTRTVIVRSPCQEYSATVATHISQGRAYACGSFSMYGCAKGSGDNLGSRYGYTPVLVHEEPAGSGTFHAGACQ